MLRASTNSKLRRVALCVAAVNLWGLPLVADVAAQPAPAHEAPWRRTAQGWERRDAWAISTPRGIVAPEPHRAPHPALVAMAIAAAAIAALLVLEKRPTAGHSPEYRQPHWRRKTDRAPVNRSMAATRPTLQATKREIFAGERERQPRS